MTAELRALLALAVIAVLGWVGYQLLFSDSAAAAVVLSEVRGDVQVESGGQRGAATAGAPIHASDRLVSGADGSAVLAFGTQSRVTVQANTSVQVTSVDPTGVRLSLEDGRVQATVRPGGPRLGIDAAGRAIRADDADFEIVRSPDGVAVQSSRGAVDVDGAAVAAGDRTVIPSDGSPMQMPVSDALLLQMAWPAQDRTSTPKVRLTGTTEPSAKVTASTSAGTATTRADRAGAFVIEVALGEGENAVVVRAVNLFGQVAKAEWRVARDSTPPAIGVRIE